MPTYCKLINKLQINPHISEEIPIKVRKYFKPNKETCLNNKICEIQLKEYLKQNL